MAGAEAGLALLVAAGAAMRAAGLAVAGRLRPDHPFIQWATAVSLATLAAFVVASVVAPTGLLARVPVEARLIGAAIALAAWARGGGLLRPVLAGVVAAGGAWWLAT